MDTAIFLKYLKRRDTDMLRILLDDSITYFGASKKVFLERLDFIFCYLDNIKNTLN